LAVLLLIVISCAACLTYGLTALTDAGCSSYYLSAADLTWLSLCSLSLCCSDYGRWMVLQHFKNTNGSYIMPETVYSSVVRPVVCIKEIIRLG